MKKKLFSALCAVALLLSAIPASVSAAQVETVEIPMREYADCEVPPSILAAITLDPSDSDYQALASLEYDILQETNQLFEQDLPRRATMEDVQNAEWYQVYYTEENIYSAQNTSTLMELLEDSRPCWECYIPVEESIVKVDIIRRKKENSDSYQDGYWSLSAFGMMEGRDSMRGYQAAVQAGLEASQKDAAQAVLVSNGCGDIVCLLCSDTVDTLITVNPSTVTGDEEFLGKIVLPGTRPEDGIFDYQQVAANAQSFFPQAVPEEEILWTGPQAAPGIVQQQGAGLPVILLWCGVGTAVAAACVVGVLVWRRKARR